jgi:phenylpropionate dioxygenase-like ring-hydroxylating dioxygenase large terminal subunit
MAMDAFVKASVTPGQTALPARWYVSPDAFAAERERIFACEWICVGRSESIGDAGDFVLAQVAGESLIVTRDASGTFHAFYNVCRHRGTQMCEAEGGRFMGSIQCPYHGWTYGLDGTLKAARNMADVAGFRREDYALREAAIAQWEGFLFVNLAADPEPFERAFAPRGRSGRCAPRAASTTICTAIGSSWCRTTRSAITARSFIRSSTNSRRRIAAATISTTGRFSGATPSCVSMRAASRPADRRRARRWAP